MNNKNFEIFFNLIKNETTSNIDNYDFENMTLELRIISLTCIYNKPFDNSQLEIFKKYKKEYEFIRESYKIIHNSPINVNSTIYPDLFEGFENSKKMNKIKELYFNFYCSDVTRLLS